MLITALLGCVLHCLFAWFATFQPQSDAADYHQLGLTIAHTHTYEVHGHPTAYRPIGFPAVLALVYSIQESIFLAQIVQSILISITGICIALLIYAANSSRVLSIIGMIIWFILPLTFVQTSVLLSEPLSIAAMLSAIVLQSQKKDKILLLICSGICWGIAVLSRPSFLLPAFVITAFIAIHNATIKESCKRFLITISSLSIVVSPWIIRNAIVMGKPMLSTNGGINLLIGNNPQANGSYKAIDALSKFDMMSETDADAKAMDEVKNYIYNNPLQALLRIPKKIAYLFASDTYLALQSFAKPSLQYRESVRSLSFWNLSLFIIPGALIMLLGLYYLPLASHYEIGTIAIITMIVWCIVHAIYFGSPRYHEPLIPFMIISFILGISTNNARYSHRLLILPTFQVFVFLAEIAVYYNVL